jgi:phage terminase large subunit-like protein
MGAFFIFMVKAIKKPKVSKKWRQLLCCLPGYDPFCQAGDSWFEPEIAQYYIDFIEECCSHIEGALAGKPFILERWEQAIVANLFGWQKIDSYGRQVRRYREAFIYVPRKNGKTPLAAALMNAAYFLDDEAGQQNYCAAGERDQATLSFRHINGMQQNEIEMSSRVHPYKSTRTIVKHEDQSFIKVLSSDADTKHGGNPHIILVDELHVQKDRRLVDVFQTSMASLNRKQPLLIHLTTADYVRESICNEKYEKAVKVRDNKGSKLKAGYDPEFLPVIYEAGPKDDWKKPATWRKANPNLGVSVSIDFMRRECKRAAETPTYENTFKRLHLNIRTAQDVRWIPAELWDSCNFAISKELLIGQRCYAGFDLSTNKDIAGYALLFPPAKESDKWRVLPRFYIPKDNAEKREDRDKVPYITWAREGLITLTDGNVIDYDTIKADFEVDCQNYAIAEIAFDRWNFEGPRQRFIADGAPADKFVSFGQGFASMSAPARELEKLLLAKELAHGGHPVLAWMAGNVAVEMDAAGNIKPSKKVSKEKIDGIVMLIMALGRAMVAAAPKESVYEKRGIVTI